MDDFFPIKIIDSPMFLKENYELILDVDAAKIKISDSELNILQYVKSIKDKLNDFTNFSSKTFSTTFITGEMFRQPNSDPANDLFINMALPTTPSTNNKYNVNIAPDLEVNTSISLLKSAPDLHARNMINKLSVLKLNSFAIFSFGTNNIILGFINKYKELVLLKRSLYLLFDTAPPEIAYDRLIKLLTYYDDKIKYFSNREMSEVFIEKDYFSQVLQNTIRSISNISSSKLTKSELSKSIVNSMSSIFKIDGNHNHALLYNSNVQYKKMVLKFLEKIKQIEKNNFSKGLKIGISFYHGMMRAGYSTEFGSTDNNWKKKVEIIPTLAYKKNKIYELDAESQKLYTIKDLHINIDSLSGNSSYIPIRCLSKHPNIGGAGEICIGDELRKEWVDLIESPNFTSDMITNFLLKVEDALKIPNLDSAYFQIENSHLKEIVNPKIPKTTRSETTGRRLLV